MSEVLLVPVLMLALCCEALEQGRVGNTHPQLVTSTLAAIVNDRSVTSLHLDSQGILWIGTQSGLLRFDGVSAHPYGPTQLDESWLPASKIVSIAEDGSGGLYVATEPGQLLWQKNGSEGFINLLPSTVDSLTIDWIHPGKDGTVWIGTDRGIRNLATSYSTAEATVNIEIGRDGVRSSAIAQASSGHIFIAQGQKVLVVDEEFRQKHTIDISKSDYEVDAPVSALEYIAQDRIAVGTRTGSLLIVPVYPSEEIPLYAATISPGVRITKISSIDSGLLVGTDRGLFFVKNPLVGSSKVIRLGDGLRDSDVYDIHQYGNSVLVATFSGLHFLLDPSFTLANHLSDAITYSVNDFGEDRHGNIWIGSDDGLEVYGPYGNDPQDELREHLQNHQVAPGNGQIMQIESVGASMFLGYYRNGLTILDIIDDQLVQHRPRALEGAGIVTMFATKEDEVWIGTHEHGLYRWADGQLSDRLGTDVLEEPFILWIESMGNSDLIIGTMNYLYRYDRATNIFVKLPIKPLPNYGKPIILSAKEDEAGNIWFGTRDMGLWVWPKDFHSRKEVRLVRPTTSSEMQHDNIYAIRIDESKNLWMSTDDGVIKASNTGSFLWRFGEGDGLQGQSFNWGASFKSSDGAMFFGGPNGFNTFFPEKVRIDKTPPKTILSKVHYPDLRFLNFRNSTGSIEFQVTHKDRFITFEAGIINPKDSLNSSFRFKLEGYDPDWVYTGTHNTATYTNLPAGDYVLKAQSSNAAGIWDPEGLKIPVTVVPPPWLSWWAYLCYFALALLAVWVGHRTYQSYVIQRHAADLALRITAVEESAEEEVEEHLEFHEAVLGSAYDHKQEMLRLINAIIYTSTNDEDANTFGARKLRALELLEECMFYGIEGAKANLHEFTELAIAELIQEIVSEPGKLITSVAIPKYPVPAAAATPLALIIYELLRNAMQHAFPPQSPANYIHVTLDVDEKTGTAASHYRLTVTDSGSGAPPDLLLDTVTGSGAERVAAIVQLYRGTCEVDVHAGTSIQISFSVAPSNTL